MFFMKTANVSEERVNLQPTLGLRPHSEQETVGALYKALPPCELKTAMQLAQRVFMLELHIHVNSPHRNRQMML
jgi:hypothetical protein